MVKKINEEEQANFKDKTMSQSFTIGNQEEMDIYIPDGKEQGMSRHHATFELLENGVVLLKDNNSLNCTYVNGFRIRRKLITEGDKLKFGKYKATLTYFLKKTNDGSYQLRKPINDFSEEFQRLQPLENTLRQQINKLRAAQDSLTFTFRIFVFIPSVSGIIYTLTSIAFPTISTTLATFIQSHFWLISLFVIAYVIAFLWIIYQLYAPSRKTARKEQLQQLEVQHQEIFVCPRCKEYLSWEKDWLVWKQLGKHDLEQCTANFVT